MFLLVKKDVLLEELHCYVFFYLTVVDNSRWSTYGIHKNTEPFNTNYG